MKRTPHTTSIFPGVNYLPARIAARVVQVGACLVWTGAKTGHGYGAAQVDGRLVALHRLAYAAVHGPIPPGVVIRHTCDVKPCIRADHLLGGSQAENIADTVRRGRHAFGERVGTAKLTAGEAFAVRWLASAGRPRRQIAALFGVTAGNVSAIVARRSWASIP